MDNHKSQKKNKINQEKQVDWIEAMKDMNYKGIEVVTQWKMEMKHIQLGEVTEKM